jgi:uncharacterized protein YndB with AHSA1/START domain
MPIHGRTIEHTISIAAPPERVWTALTDIRELNQWETTSAHLDLRVGGDFLYVFEYGPPRPGTFLAIDPPRRLVQLNQVYNRYESFRYVNSLTLEPAPEGTRLHVLVEGFGDGEVERWLCESMDLGWEGDLQLLKGWVEQGRNLRPEIWPGLYMGIEYVSEPGGGIRLLEVFSGSPAFGAGLRPADVIVRLDDRRVEDFRGFRRLLGDYSIGDAVSVEFLREGEAQTELLTFGDAVKAESGATTGAMHVD